MRSVRLERLMRYHDGELSAEEAQEIENRLAEDRELRAELQRYRSVGAALAEWAELRSPRALGIGDLVLDRLQDESGARRRPSAAPEAHSEPSSDQVSGLRLVQEQRVEPLGQPLPASVAPVALVQKRRVPRWPFAAAASCAAMAAGTLLWVKSGQPPVQAGASQGRPVAERGEIAEPAPRTQAVQAEPADPSPAASIESVDFGQHLGTIFLVSSGGTSTPVVWLSDDDGFEGSAEL